MSVKSVVIDGVSLHELALRFDRPDYFDMLLEATRHMTEVHDEDGAILPLLVTVQGNDPRVVHRIGLLLDRGANIDARTGEGDTALILAGWTTGNVALVRRLLERGADVNLANANGDTALIDAASLGRQEILETLLDGGADPDIRNGDGKSALDRAREEGHTQAAESLVSQRDRNLPRLP